MEKAITSFRGRYFFLSNFYPCSVKYSGMTFENNEAAFQAMKCPSRKAEFCKLAPSEAKKLGRKVQLRGDWEQNKYDIMYQICKAKFSQNPDMRKLLLSTGDSPLVEGNTWGDREWGVCNGTGENKLGKILMRVRRELRGS